MSISQVRAVVLQRLFLPVLLALAVRGVCLCAVSRQEVPQTPTPVASHRIEDSQSGAKTQLFRYQATAAGSHHLWSESESEMLWLEVHGSDGVLLERDAGSGGAGRPYVELQLEQGQEIVVEVGLANPIAGDLLALYVVQGDASREERATAEAVANPSWRPAGSDPGRIEAALTFYEAHLPRTHPTLALLRYRLGILCSEGQLGRAVELFERVLSTERTAQEEQSVYVLGAMTNLIRALIRQGELDAAETMIEEAERRPWHAGPEVQEAQYNLRIARAILACERGDLALGRDYFENAVRDPWAQAGEGRRLRDKARMNLAIVDYLVGDYELARHALELLLAELGRPSGESMSTWLDLTSNLALVLKAQGDYGAAQVLEAEIFEKRLASSAPHAVEVQDARLNLAETLALDGNPEAGLELLDEVTTTAHASASAGQHYDALRARLLAYAGQHELAREAYANALPGVRALFSRERRERHEFGLEHAWLEFLVGDVAGAVRAALGLVDEMLQARQEVLLTLSPREVVAWCASAEGTLGGLLGLVLKLEPAAEQRQMLEQACEELLEALHGAGMQAAALGRGLGASEEVNSLQFEVRAQTAEQCRLGLLGETEAALEALRLRDRAYRELAQLVSAASLEPTQARAQAAGFDAGQGRSLTYVSFMAESPFAERQERLGCFVVREGAREWIDLGSLSELRLAASAWVAQLLQGGNKGAELARDAGTSLRRRLLDPCLMDLAQGASVDIVPADFMHSLPLDILPGLHNKASLLGEEYPLKLELEHARVGVLERTEQPRQHVFLAGGLDYGELRGAMPAWLRRCVGASGFAALPDSAREVLEVAQLVAEQEKLGLTLCTGADLGASQLATAVRGARYLVLATHAFAAPAVESGRRLSLAAAEETPRFGAFDRGLQGAPMYGLALSGANLASRAHGPDRGYITGPELALLDLTHCEVAVLSACEGYRGSEQRDALVPSLQRALHMAGARYVLSSLWKAPDTETAQLVTAFFRNLFTGSTHRTALWQAKLSLRDQGMPVRYWAGWVLTGHE